MGGQAMKSQFDSKFILVVLGVIFLLFPACASSPDSIAATSVSTVMYQNYTCDQLMMEADRVSREVQRLHASLEKEANNDAAQMAIGMVIFWPALFFLEGGDGPEAAEYARLKGEKEAINKLSITRNCTLPSPTKKTPQQEPVKIKTKAAISGEIVEKKPEFEDIGN